MKAKYIQLMDVLHRFCMVIAGACLVVITLIIPWGVFTRYVLNSASSWPEPMAVLLMILFTFFAGAACYRAGIHISVALFADALRQPYRRIVHGIAELSVAVLAVFMVYWGFQLVATTWSQVIAEFPFLSVGVTYLPIPLGGAITLLFILERAWIGKPPLDSIMYREPAEAN